MRDPPPPLTLAVIGAGASGVLVATQLMQQARSPFHLLLIESRPLIGCGVAYSTLHPDHLLNVPVGKLSAFPHLPNHFAEYVLHSSSQNVSHTPDVTPAFVPRSLYGLYLQTVLQEARRQCNLVTLEQVCGEVIALIPSEEGAWLHLKDGRQLHAHQVILALGNFPPRDPFVTPPAFSESSRYRANLWSADTLTDLAPSTAVLLVGTGLTMIDAAVALHEQKHTGPIFALSRHGLLPYAHASTALSPISLQLLAPPLTTRRLFHWIRTEISQAIQHGRDWRAVIDGLRPHTQTLWQGLSLEEKLRFLRHVQTLWNVRRHRMAPAIATIIETMRATGQLQIYAGRLRHYKDRDDGLLVTFTPRRTNQDSTLHVERVINCTGPNTKIDRQQHPLLTSLLDQGLIRPDPLGMGLDVTENGAIISTKEYGPLRLWTLGPLCVGSRWETTAIPEIRQQAEHLASKIWQHSSTLPHA